MDCIFKAERWLTPANGLDPAYMYSALNQMLPVDLTFVLPNILLGAYTECGSIITAPSTDPALSPNANSTIGGRRCMHGPTKWFRCIRRFLLLNCSPSFQPAPQFLPKSCGVEKLMIERCDVHTL
ncbi:hypothetical protein B566_EDAN010722 [Ephemera danica]|nr:hypothetical protein B566_EDAN010722 [Ephemera danica]